jgi:hypothetical protein
MCSEAGDGTPQTGNFEVCLPAVSVSRAFTSSAGVKWRWEVLRGSKTFERLLPPKIEFPVYQGQYREFSRPEGAFLASEIA